MSQYRPTLPIPPEEYDPAYERRRNARIEDMLRNKLDQFGVPVFGGVPTGILNGDNTLLTIPKNVETQLPFNSIFINNLDLIDRDPTPTFKPQYTVLGVMGVSIMSLTDQSQKFNRATFRLYAEGNPTELGFVSEATPFFPDIRIHASIIYYFTPPYNRMYLTFEHDAAGSIDVDMTRSRWNWQQLTANPTLTEQTRFSETYDTNQESIKSSRPTASRQILERFSLSRGDKDE